ncbi:hypothetical protein F8388_013218 [Cannabis sativa]|uniref:G domain-containing protein n=1 Tax=Cannabis sativa TaxID=3483 RepID=A0A7J6DY83_CANSA|nr:hypothetical protein F8388_013218 [Cannabis sativa]
MALIPSLILESIWKMFSQPISTMSQSALESTTEEYPAYHRSMWRPMANHAGKGVLSNGSVVGTWYEGGDQWLNHAGKGVLSNGSVYVCITRDSFRSFFAVNSKATLMFSNLMNDEISESMFWPELPYGSLLSVLRQFACLKSDKQAISVGFVGYFNVGKSSVINTLRTKTVCKVAPIPGETKVWQSITLTKRIFLIDCPGVVYQNNHDTETDIVLKGVVRVTNLEDALEHIGEVLTRVKKERLERAYKIKDCYTKGGDTMQSLTSEDNFVKDKQIGRPKIWFYRDKVTNEPKGDATVTYEDPHAAIAAVEWFNKMEIGCAQIQVLYLTQVAAIYCRFRLFVSYSPFEYQKSKEYTIRLALEKFKN